MAATDEMVATAASGRDPAVAALLPEARQTIRQVARTFALAARLLPRDVREDTELLYLVLRTLDDLVDLEGAHETDLDADQPRRLPVRSRTRRAVGQSR